MTTTPPPGVAVNYELLRIRCGKKNCRCRSANQSDWHGPYWYAYWNDPKTGKKRSLYKGKRFRPPTAKRDPIHAERMPEGSSTSSKQRAKSPPPPPPPPPRSRATSGYADERDAQILGMSASGFTREDLKRAWRKKIGAVHPDRFQGAQRAEQEEIAKQVNEAYQRILKRHGWTR